MPSKTSTARMTGKTAVAVARRPMLRRATVKAAKPPAKAGWYVGKIVVRRKAKKQVSKAQGHLGKARDQMGNARDQMVRVGAAGKTLGSLVLVYGPMAAEVFGLVEKPKPKPRAPVFGAGLAVGAGAAAGAAYLLSRKNSG